ncbi:adenylyltransferase/cytidyltransferase family protein [bacterium]|nr:adenylyltransferase/cytidyltransferase family protein [bacterium]
MKKTKTVSEKWVAVSGGFDPIHIGHVRMMQAARKLGDRLLVILNNDHWLRDKKGFAFMPQKEKVELLKSFPFVDKVVLTDHKPGDQDRSVSRTLRKVKPHIFANGGDRGKGNTPEMDVCKDLGITMRFNVGKGGKVQSSSWMINASSREVRRSVRPWGEFYGWDSGQGWYLKTLYVNPNSRLSLQYHHHRSERWVLVQGDATAVTIEKGKEKKTKLKVGETFIVPKRMPHRLTSKNGGTLVEVAVGNFDENDIVRLQDDHGRV